MSPATARSAAITRSAAARPAAARTRASSPLPARRPDERAPLRLVRHEPRRRRFRLAPILAVSLLVCSLLTVVVGHALLAQGQVKLSAAQTVLATEQAAHRQALLDVAALETPGRITREAAQVLHMVDPGQVHQVPSVPLGHREAAPKVAPATTTTPTTAASTPTSTTPTTTTPATQPGSSR